MFFRDNIDIDLDIENEILENIDIDIEPKFDIVPCLLWSRPIEMRDNILYLANRRWMHSKMLLTPNPYLIIGWYPLGSGGGPQRAGPMGGTGPWG